MKVKVLKTFSDKESKQLRRAEEEIEVSEERFIEINSTKHGVLVEEVEEEVKKEIKKDKKK